MSPEASGSNVCSRRSRTDGCRLSGTGRRALRRNRPLSGFNQPEYEDRLIEMERRAWSDHQRFQHVTGTSICLSCLLEAGRYDELQELLAARRTKFRSWHRFGAEALVHQGLWEAAIAFAEGVRDTSNSRHDDNDINNFCEGLLIQHSRTDEAYRKYGLRAATGTTNLAVYRALARQYPDRDRRQILLDLIESRGDKSKWFAAAMDE